MKLELDIVAATLEGLEETIISKLIDRAQFRVNEAVYMPGKSGFAGEDGRSLFDLKLRYQEEMDALFGRFCVSEERPFTTNLPAPRRRMPPGDTGLAVADFNIVNLSADIRMAYTALVREICADGDDGHYGSSVEHDVYAMQALSRRIHYGSFYVAECKYRQEPDVYQTLIDARDTGSIMERLTRKPVEDAIIGRVREKVAYAQARVNTRVRICIDPGSAWE
jgi:chorismate mutase